MGATVKDLILQVEAAFAATPDLAVLIASLPSKTVGGVTVNLFRAIEIEMPTTEQVRRLGTTCEAPKRRPGDSVEPRQA